jgi:hypothetical protein
MEIKMTETQLWEYQVLTIGNVFGAKDNQIQETLNEWGVQGWELAHVYTPSGSSKVTIVAKRPLTERTRRQRSMPRNFA